MKRFLFFIIIFIWALPAFATMQFPEHISYKGQELTMRSYPLEDYLTAHPQAKKNLEGTALCSACWRGYIGTWKIEKGVLYLTKLVEGTCADQPNEIQISKVMPETTLPVKASWYTGTLRIYYGGMVDWVYPKRLLIEITEGVVQSEKIVNKSKGPPSSK